MMVRAKKNKIRSNEKQLKLKIKNLKNQLGKVRSNKEAKKQKNKIIHKKWLFDSLHRSYTSLFLLLFPTYM